MKARLLIVVLVLSGLFLAASNSYACTAPPDAILEVFREYVVTGRSVILDGSDSTDPDGTIIKYEWDFTDNGSYDYYETSSHYPDGAFDGITTHTYGSNGTYTVRLRVTDNDSFTDTDTCTIYVGPDSDGDGLPDDWEDLYGFDPNDPDDADQDYDYDGYNNLSEYLHGSAPNNASSVPSSNITIYVPTEVNSIQRAINASIDGDIIAVNEGTYYENIDFNGLSITITSIDPEDPYVVANTIIDANSDSNNPGRVVTFDNNEDANSILTGFTIKGGYALGTGNLSDGGGIYCEGSSPTISRCVIQYNYAADDGGGICCYDGSSPTISCCQINYNEAGDGGGICCNDGSSPTISYCNITDNEAEDKAGGIYCKINSCPTIKDCEISLNDAYKGGGIYCSASEPEIERCIISDNQTFADGLDENYADGGGIYCSSSSPRIINCLITYNVSDDDAGGIYCYNGSDPNIINCTFSGNQADDKGGGIYCKSNSDAVIINCILWDDTAPNGPEIHTASSSPVVSYSDVEGGWSGTGNINSDPCFVDANDPAGPDGVFGTIDDGLQPQIGSPCIDAGDPSTDPNDVGPVDLVGNDRIMDGNHDNVEVIDMGAYELQAIWFVDVDATGNDDGSSWQDAFDDLQDALYEADDGDEIWVAEGTYKPTSGSSRSVSFALVEGVAIYGGFDGTETGLDQRDWTAHETILSGDIGTPNNLSDNSYHVVTTGSGTSQTAVLDGFTITGGNANVYPNDTGGGMNNKGNPTVINCTFSDNSASYGGGMCNGYYNGHSSPTLTNCTFSGNSASAGGGGIFNYMYSNPVLTNCAFSENSSGSYGGAINNYCSGPTLTNCIFWADTAEEIYNYSSNPTFSYCDIEGCSGSEEWDPNFGTDGGGNIDSNPYFVDVNDPDGPDDGFCPVDDGLRLQVVSPCIDAADGDVAPSTDILGRGRIDIDEVENTGTGSPDYVDIGAYESYSGVDSDGDGMPDDWELIYGLDPTDSDDAELDGDEDELTNLEEYQAGTDPTDSDTDDDGMKDGWEVDNNLDPLDSSDANEDPDNDGLSNVDEYNSGNNSTDPHDKDSDDDYLPDGWEVDNGLNPNSDAGNDGANGNPDGDDYTNLSEYLHGSDPQDDQSVPVSTTTITVPTEAGSIQWAIDLSIGGDVVEILKGRYYETIDFNDTAITLTSTDPNDWWVVESTIIDGNGASTAVATFDSGDASSTLTGLTLTNAEYGISCNISSSPTITRCIIEDCNSHGIYCTAGSPEITNNMIGENTGDGIYSSSSTPPAIKNNWIYKNSGKGIEFNSASSAATVRNNTIVGSTGQGIYVSSGTAPTVSNCILWSNNGDLDGCNATYSCIEDGADPNYHNISSDPQFIDGDSSDYRLQRTSPCINAGDPNQTYTDEKDIEAEVREAKTVDMGADEVCEVHNFTAGVWYSGVDGEGIQDAMDDANEGDVIEVYEWTFYESVDFKDINVTLKSTDPCNWDVVECTIIDADDSDANVVTFDSGQDANSVLKGFTITVGKNGVYCDNSSSPVIRNCIITGNSSAGVACVSGSPIIKRCKIGENSGDGINSSSTTPPAIKNSLIYKNSGNGISFTSAASVATIRNNTIVDNNDCGISVSGTEPNISNCILWGHDGNDLESCNATYSCIEDINDANGVGNITSDPMFASDNYNLDLLSSPCIGAGDPCATYSSDEVDLYGNELSETPDMGTVQNTAVRVKVGATGKGKTWNNAADLQHALREANIGKEIWIQKGTYYPDIYQGGTPSGSRGESFVLKKGVRVHGGFAGGENSRNQRDWKANQTILSGDIQGNIDPSYHVIIGEEGAVLDGLTIEGGRADGGGIDDCGAGMLNYMCTPAVSNCTFIDNYASKDGGGMSNVGAVSTPALTKCTFENNTAGGNGGAIDNWRAVPNIDSCVFVNNSAVGGGSIFNNANYSGCTKITNCVFYDNSATNGGGVYNYLVLQQNIPKVTNCTYHENTATSYGNSVRNIGSSPKITNCIMWNIPGQGAEVSNVYVSYPNITYCDIKDGYSGTGNIDADPKFADSTAPAGPPGPNPPEGDNVYGTFDDGLRIKFHSPCVDAATSTGAPSTDVLGLKRVDIRAVTDSGAGTYPWYDMGAYEAVVEHVIFISVDGLASEYLKHDHLLESTVPSVMPNMKRIKNEGLWTYNARTDYRYTNTLPTHVTMVTGRTVEKGSLD